MFLFVQARIASQRRRARCPFLAIYIKYRFFSTFGKNIDESRTPMHESPPSPSSFLFSFLLPLNESSSCDYLSPGGETGSSRFNERHHKGEKSLFSRLYPISRLHPSHPPLPSRPCPAFESVLSQSRPSFCSIYLKLGFLPYPSTLFSRRFFLFHALSHRPCTFARFVTVLRTNVEDSLFRDREFYYCSDTMHS